MCESTWVFFSRPVAILICNFDMFERQGGVRAKLQVCFRPRHEAKPRTGLWKPIILGNSMVNISAHLHPRYSGFELSLYQKTKAASLSKTGEHPRIPIPFLLVRKLMKPHRIFGVYFQSRRLKALLCQCSLCARRLLLQRSDSAWAQLGLPAIR